MTEAVTGSALSAAIGATPRRKEDPRYLRGEGRYLDDLAPPGLGFVAFVRSPHAHAAVVRVDASAALARPGVRGVFTLADLPEIARSIPAYSYPGRFPAYAHLALADGRVRYVGEAVVAVVADDRYAAADAVDDVAVEYRAEPAVTDAREGIRNLAPHVHPEWGSNLVGVARTSIGDSATAMASADVVVDATLYYPRGAGMPIETRGVLALADPITGALTVWSSTQAVFLLRTALATILEIPAERIRVIAPDVGGAFGAKAQVYGEEIVVPALARRLGRPLKWVESRTEHLLGTAHDRDQRHEARLGLRRDGVIVAVESTFVRDTGAYPIQGEEISANTVNHLVGAYRIPAYRAAGSEIVTNKMFSAAYRGAGRPEAAFVIDRLLDRGARALGIDPAELRRRNLIGPAELPYRPGLTYKDGVPITYDPGDFPACYEAALARLGYPAYRREQARGGRGHRRLGLGTSCYLQGTALGPFEGAVVKVDPSGQVYVYVGVSSQGQAHATTLAQICADELGVRFEDVTVTGGDTTLLGYGIGAVASRVAAVAGPAVARAAREVGEKARLLAATLLETSPKDVEIRDGVVSVVGSPFRRLALADVAAQAQRARALAPAGSPGLDACTYFFPETVTWACGAQAAAVEVDLDTGVVEVLRYVAVHDSGRAINPVVVDGQLHGGVAQGLGAALYEDVVYDERGQLVTANFMEFCVPRAAQLPPIDVARQDSPSPMNDLGIKGVGESGIISPGAVIANAVEDALAEFDVHIDRLPVTPARIFELLRRARSAPPSHHRGGAPWTVD